MFHRFPVQRIADHLGEGGNTWIFGDEAMVPTLFRRTDQHQFEPSLPDDPAAQPLEYRPAFPAVGRICFGAGRLATVGIGRLPPQPRSEEHTSELQSLAY